MADREGFEPSVPFWGTHTFQACSFDHSDTCPLRLCRSLTGGILPAFLHFGKFYFRFFSGRFFGRMRLF